MKYRPLQSFRKPDDNPWRFLLVVALIALAVRTIFYLTTRHELWFQFPIVDAEYYNNWAARILRGDILSNSEGVFLMNPGYPYFLAVAYSIFGFHPAGIVILQYFLGTLSCMIVFFIASILFNRPTAILASLIAATYGISIFYESTLLTACLINFLDLLAILLILLSFRRDKPSLLAVSGILLGYSASKPKTSSAAPRTSKNAPPKPTPALVQALPFPVMPRWIPLNINWAAPPPALMVPVILFLWLITQTLTLGKGTILSKLG